MCNIPKLDFRLSKGKCVRDAIINFHCGDLQSKLGINLVHAVHMNPLFRKLYNLYWWDKIHPIKVRYKHLTCWEQKINPPYLVPCNLNQEVRSFNFSDFVQGKKYGMKLYFFLSLKAKDYSTCSQISQVLPLELHFFLGCPW